jgi:light-regulated signal transduction histidine kinase (bacteriophytochrome)
LLSFSRIDSDGQSVRPVDPQEIIALAIENLSEAIKESRAVVTMDEFPILFVDPSQLTQLFQNLIGNAIKYRGEEPPRVHISCVVAAKRCIFAVADNGIGIATAYREQVFGVFKRLHNQTKYKGTGIGLAVCKRIVERAGGRIWIEGPPDGGSVFQFDLPLATSIPRLPPTSVSGYVCNAMVDTH